MVFIIARRYRYYHDGCHVVAIWLARGSNKGGTCRPTRRERYKAKESLKSMEIK